MPLIVHCPNGCVIRVPLARAGTIVRCSECKSVIQLRRLSPSESSGGQTIEVRASLAQIHTLGSGVHAEPLPATHDELLPAAFLDRGDELLIHPPAKVAPSNLHRELASETESTGSQNGGKTTGPNRENEFELPVPRPARLRFTRGRRPRDRSRHSNRPITPAADVAEIDLGLNRPSDATDFDSIQVDEDGFEDRSDSDYQFLSHFYAACIGVMGLVLISLSTLAWSGWSVLPVQPLGSRWIFIMIFLGGLHLVYSIFLFQIPERAALWSVSIFLLMVGCIHGVFTAGTWLDKGSGPVSRFLQLPPTETAAVTLWCFLHLCFSVIFSYLCGRLAQRWKLKLQRRLVQSQ